MEGHRVTGHNARELMGGTIAKKFKIHGAHGNPLNIFNEQSEMYRPSII